MKLHKLSIRRMPGFEAKGFDLDLSDGINLIIGPNGSGKTTSCRAIQGLLWPDTLKGTSPVSLMGKWDENGESVLLELEGTIATCERNDVPADKPPLPGTNVAKCFTVTVSDLFQGTETDAELAATVIREMAGGYDLKALLDLDVFSFARSIGRKESKALVEAKSTANKIEAEQEALRSDEEKLPELNEQEQEAEDAEAGQKTLADVRELLDAREKEREVETLLSSFPQGMDLVRGNEKERLKQIQDDLIQAEEDTLSALTAKDKARKTIQDAALPEGGILDTRLKEQKVHLEELRETEQKLTDRRRRAEDAKIEVAKTLSVFGEGANADKLDAIEVEGLNDVETFHRDCERNEWDRGARQSKLDLLGEGEEQGNMVVLINGISFLRQWFEAGSTESKINPRLLGLTWILTGLVAAVGCALALFLNVLWLLLLLFSGMAAVAAFLLSKSKPADKRQVLQEQYERLPLDAPASWEREAVGKSLNMHESELAKARQIERDTDQRKELKSELVSLGEKDKAVDQRRQELIESLGVSPETSSLALSVLATNLILYRKARLAQGKDLNEITELQEHRTMLLAKTNAFLTEFGDAACDTYDIACVRYEAIEERANQYRQANTQLEEAVTKRDKAQRRKKEFSDRRQKLFNDIGLEDSDDLGLEKRLEVRKEYKDADKERQDVMANQKALLHRLKDAPDERDLTMEEVNAKDESLQKMAEDYKPIVRQIQDIRSRIDSVKRDSKLEIAGAEVERAKNKLSTAQEKADFATAGKFLIDDVQKEYEIKSQPAVLRQASQWLGIFTRGRYELRLDDTRESDEPSFRGFDTTAKRGLPLTSLSGGTRMQLLLAVRLAFAVAAERGGTQLPFILDEVLSSSDPVRLKAIIECVLKMVKEGRQVLYFTCQPSDAKAWKDMADEMGIADVRRIDLADAHLDEKASSELLTSSAAEVKPVPEPEGLSLEEYKAALGVPPLKPSAGASAAHVAHLGIDPEHLHQLAKAGIDTFGQLESLASKGPVDGYVAQEVLERIRIQAQVLDAFAEAWAVGVGMRLSREVLLESDISESFIDRIAGLARDHDWDAKQLVDALTKRVDERTKGFRTSTLETLIENLTNSGHLSAEDPLEKDEVFERVLAVMNDPIKQGLIDVFQVRRMLVGYWETCASEEGRDAIPEL